MTTIHEEKMGDSNSDDLSEKCKEILMGADSGLGGLYVKINETSGMPHERKTELLKDVMEIRARLWRHLGRC